MWKKREHPSKNQQVMHVITSDNYKAHGYKSYIAASYVKFVEMAGARAVPVLLDQSDEYYMRVFQGTNGMLVPGGGADVHNSSQHSFFKI